MPDVALPSPVAPAMSSLLTTGEILATREVIDPVFLDSPSMRHLALDDALGCAVTLKVETLNPIRSFKGRGTEAVLAALTPRPAAVVTASSGNFGQGVAWAARRRAIVATVFAPADANPLKVAAMQRLGASVHLVERGRDESDAAREAAAGPEAPTLVEDGGHRQSPPVRRDRPGVDRGWPAAGRHAGPDRRRRAGRGRRIVAESCLSQDTHHRSHGPQCPRDGGVGRGPASGEADRAHDRRRPGDHAAHRRRIGARTGRRRRNRGGRRRGPRSRRCACWDREGRPGA